jgi:Transient receptor potential (TRP) ion channel
VEEQDTEEMPLTRRILFALIARAKAVAASLHAILVPERPPGTRREIVLAALLNWCRTGGKLALPVLEWEEMEEGEEAEALDHQNYLDSLRRKELEKVAEEEAALAEAKAEAAAGPAARKGLMRSLSKMGQRRARVHIPQPPIRSADLPKLQKKALQEVGFLFAAYHTKTWYWESIELVRKLALTSILALISPGSAGQVVVGFLLAFTMLIANLQIRPFAESGLNFINIIAQLNLVAFLFVALLLKVNVDNEGSAGFFTGVGAFSPSLLPRSSSVSYPFPFSWLHDHRADRAPHRHQALADAVRQHGGQNGA